MAVDMKKVSRGILEEAFGKGKLEYLDQICDASFKGHDPLMGELDLAGFKRLIETMRGAFPDLTPSLVAICAEGDSVCTYWRCVGTHQKALMGAAPTGKRITVEGMTFDRFRNGKLVESTSQWDALGLLQGVGLLPKIELRPQQTETERRPHA